MSKPRLVSFYLPQFYPTPENDEWWEPGFTEWTNVAKAKPLFKGHYQPKIPADLSFYDLRVPETRERQAELAREAGIEGFCYWHYWFAGRRLLDCVFREVVESGKPDYPFCLCWANHSWYQKTWDPTKPDKLLIEQTYPGVQDYINHFNAMLPAFKDKRYMKVNGKLIFGVFAPLGIPDFTLFKETWNKLAKENGLDGFCFFAYDNNIYDKAKIMQSPYDLYVADYLNMSKGKRTKLQSYLYQIGYKFKIAHKIPYQQYADCVCDNLDEDKKSCICINPNFDHSPRSGVSGTILDDSTPDNWYNLQKIVFARMKNRNHEDNLVFIKAWNEWGEGNYMEPDSKYGKGFIKATRKALDECE